MCYQRSRKVFKCNATPGQSFLRMLPGVAGTPKPNYSNSSFVTVFTDKINKKKKKIICIKDISCDITEVFHSSWCIDRFRRNLLNIHCAVKIGFLFSSQTHSQVFVSRSNDCRPLENVVVRIFLVSVSRREDIAQSVIINLRKTRTSHTRLTCITRSVVNSARDSRGNMLDE